MKIHLPAETWVEVFAWLNRREFAQKMEQLWDREFSPIAEKWLHEWSRNVKIGELEYHKRKDATQASLVSCEDWHVLPIAEVEMPKNINGFERIQISHLDNTVLAFMRKMQPLFRSINLSLNSYRFYKQEANMIPTALDHLLPIFSGGDGGEFNSIKLNEDDDIALLNDTRYSSALLNTKMLDLCTEVLLPSNLFELLVNWLFTKRAAVDAEPRMLVLYDNYEMLATTIQERFMAATTAEAFPFVIRFGADEHSDEQQFSGKTLKNDKNGQQLIMREINYEQAMSPGLVFISCPVDVSHEQLAKWEAEVVDLANDCTFMREIQLNNPTLGPLDPIDQQQQQSGVGSSSDEANPWERPGTSTSNAAQNLEEEEGKEPDKKRARLI